MSSEKHTKNVKVHEKSTGGTTLVGITSNILAVIPEDVKRAAFNSLINQVTKHFDSEREAKNRIRNIRIENLDIEIKDLMESIKIEEAKEDSNQQKIDSKYNRLDKLKLEFKELQDESDGFGRGLIKIGKNLFNKKSDDKKIINDSNFE